MSARVGGPTTREEERKCFSLLVFSDDKTEVPADRQLRAEASLHEDNPTHTTSDGGDKSFGGFCFSIITTLFTLPPVTNLKMSVVRGAKQRL